MLFALSEQRAAMNPLGEFAFNLSLSLSLPLSLPLSFYPSIIPPPLFCLSVSLLFVNVTKKGNLLVGSRHYFLHV